MKCKIISHISHIIKKTRLTSHNDTKITRLTSHNDTKITRLTSYNDKKCTQPRVIEEGFILIPRDIHVHLSTNLKVAEIKSR